jgi:hypothetical protein
MTSLREFLRPVRRLLDELRLRATALSLKLGALPAKLEMRSSLSASADAAVTASQMFWTTRRSRVPFG